MNLSIQSIHFDADKKLLAFVREKVTKLSQFHDGIVEGSVFLRLDKSGDSANKLAEIKLHVSGHDFFAKKQCSSFEEAIDTSVDAITRQLMKLKRKPKGSMAV